MHMGDPEEKAWIRNRIEGPEKDIRFTENGKKAILNKIIQAEGFEKYLHSQICWNEKIWTRRWRGIDTARTNY